METNRAASYEREKVGWVKLDGGFYVMISKILDNHFALGGL